MRDGPGTWLTGHAAARPGAAALITARETLSYATLRARIETGAAACLAAGLVPGQSLAIITASRERLVLAAGVAFHLGCPLLPLDPVRPEAWDLATESGIGQVICDRDLDTPRDLRRFDAERLAATVSARPTSPRAAREADVQLMIATSGTSGQPRAVALTGHNLATAVRASRQCLSLHPHDVWLNTLPLSHIGGFAIVLRCLEAGAAMLLHETFAVETIRRVLDENRVSHVSLVPAMLARLLDAGLDVGQASRLRHVLIGGARLDAGLARRALAAGWPLCVSYGMTETASHVCLYPGLDASWQPGDAGKPLAGVSISIVNDDHRPVSGTGRIRIAGPMVMAGYMDGARLNGAGLIDNGLTTGDLGYLDDRGHLHVLGRADEMLVSGGRNIHPHEVERLLQVCPGVRDAAVTGLPDPVWGDRLVACIAGDALLEDVEHWCRANLPGSLRPREFRAFTALPRDALGKLRRAELRQAVQHDFGLREGTLRTTDGKAGA